VSDALALATRLVQQAPALDPESISALRAVLASDGSALAVSIARVLDGVVAGAIDAGVALPELAEACATLAHADALAREAARFRIDTLLPIDRIDVPADRLRR
jgi:hypothetical protein